MYPKLGQLLDRDKITKQLKQKTEAKVRVKMIKKLYT